MRHRGTAIAAILLAIGGFLAGRVLFQTDDSEGISEKEISKSKTEAHSRLSTTGTSSVEAGKSRPDIIGLLKEVLSGDTSGVEAALLAMPEDERTEFCLALIGALDANGMRTLMETYFSRGDEESFERWNNVIGDVAMFAFAARWAEIDVQGMLSFAKKFNSDSDSEFALSVAFGAVFLASDQDLDQVLAFVKGLKGDFDDDVRDAIFERLMHSDPKKALKFGEDEGMDSLLENYYSSVKSPSEHLSEVLSLADEKERASCLQGLFSNWSESDPAAALAAALQYGAEGQVKNIFNKMIEDDPETAKLHLHTLPLSEQSELKIDLATKLAEKNPVTAMEWAQANLDESQFSDFLGSADLPPKDALQFAGQIGRDAFRQVLARYVSEDPVAAFQWLNKQPPEIQAKAGASEVADALARMDSGKLRSVIELLPSGDFRTATLRNLTGKIGARSTEDARALINGLQGEERTAAVIGLASPWVAKDPQAALNFLATENNPEASGTALYLWSSSDPTAAYQWMTNHHGTNPAMLGQLATESALASKWAYKDPAAAAAAMAALPEQIAPEQTAAAIDIWAKYDSIGASAFINESLAPGPLRDQAVLALVEQIRLRDPQSAAEWVGTISDPNLRAKAATGE